MKRIRRLDKSSLEASHCHWFLGKPLGDRSLDAAFPVNPDI